jgi:ribosomal protein S6--L-glutamate ligase
VHLCFVVEDRYRADSMPLDVADCLHRWGHDVTLIEPATDPVEVGDIACGQYDAMILKTVSEGPGLTILELAATAGCPTINEVPAIRRARDKAVAIGLALRHGLPVPRTWFVPTIEQLGRLRHEVFPLVVKPSNGSCGDGVHLAESPDDLGALIDRHPAGEGRHWLGQRYLPNPGVDLKLYATGEGVYGEVRTSPLEVAATPGVTAADANQVVPVPAHLEGLVRRVGEVFGLDIFGIDLVQAAEGWVIVDINDFPSFRLVPDGAARVARSVLRLATERSRAPVGGVGR